MKFKDLKARLSEWQINWDPKIGKGSHGAFVGLTRKTKLRRVYTLPKDQQRDVDNKYLRPLRRTFELTREDGISDDEFFG